MRALWRPLVVVTLTTLAILAAAWCLAFHDDRCDAIDVRAQFHR